MGLNIFRSFTQIPIGITFDKEVCRQIPFLAQTRRLGIESSREWGFVSVTIICMVTERRRINGIGTQTMGVSLVLGTPLEDPLTALLGQ
jgi:hypothetical protein